MVALAIPMMGLPLTAQAAFPEVRANGEHLQGRWHDASEIIATFTGVPFAAPPVGDLRWRAPRPNEPRNGLQSAREYGPGCTQGTHIVDWYADVAAEFGAGRESVGKPNGVSEDCLFLNVWTPNLLSDHDVSKLPVMVWFHGGSNKGGWSYEPNYIGAELARKGVVVVSVAYRLGPFGFFSHPSLNQSQPDEPVANFGLLDQLAALDWVQKNIASFGGAPDNVTCFGESSGAGDIGQFLADSSDKCRRFISQSPGGSYAELTSLAVEQQNGLKIASQLNIDEGEDSIDRLRGVSPQALMAAAEAALPGHYYDVVKDDRTLKGTTLEGLDREQQSNIDFLLGSNLDEAYMYIAADTGQMEVDAWLEKVAPDNASALRLQVANETDPRRALDRLRTAHNMLCPARRVAARISATGGRAWVYHFTRQRAGPGGEKLGAYHGTEIPYVFGTHDDWLPTETIDEELTGAVMDYWVQFARSGDPNVPGRPAWPMYRAEKPAVLELGEKIQVVPPVDAAMCIWLGPG